MMKDVLLKSTFHMRFENGNLTSNSPVSVERHIYAIKDIENPKIYHVSIKNPIDGNFMMEPKAMKVIKDEMVKITLEGITINDPDNKWGFDFSNYGVQFSMSALSGLTGQPGTASLLLKDKDVLIVYQ